MLLGRAQTSQEANEVNEDNDDISVARVTVSRTITGWGVFAFELKNNSTADISAETKVARIFLFPKSIIYQEYTPSTWTSPFVRAIRRPTFEEPINRVHKFAKFFTQEVSKISTVVCVFARIEKNFIDIYTIFDSDEEHTYDSIYEIEQRAFAKFGDINADFHSMNFRDLDCPLEKFIPEDAKILFQSGDRDRAFKNKTYHTSS